MFPDSVKTLAASKGAYNRGLVLRYAKAVKFSIVETDGDLITVEGTVAGNYQSFYQVKLAMDMLDEKILESSCSCPAFEKGDGLCKHCVAMALAYHDDPNGAREMAAGKSLEQDVYGATPYDEPRSTPSAGHVSHDFECDVPFDGPSNVGASSESDRWNTTRRKRKPAPSKPREAQTSMQISNVISAYAKKAEQDAKRAAAYQSVMEEDAIGQVSLVPTLMEGAGFYAYHGDARERTWQLKLRVQRGKASYVVKDVDELVRAWEQGLRVKYGKNLEFAHVRSAFDDTSNALLEMLSRVTKSQRAMYLSRERYYYAGRGTNVKDLPLSAENAIELLDLHLGGSIQYVPDGFSAGKARTTPVIDGQCMMDVTITEGESGGYDLRLPEDAECITDGKRMYLIFGGKARNCPAETVAGLGEFYDEVLPAWEPLHIREADMTAFCAAVLPQLRKHANLTEAEGIQEFTPAEAEFTFRIRLDEYGFVSCSTQVTYGRQSVNLFEEVSPDQPVRHVTREIAAQQLVRTFFPNGDFETPHYDKAGRQRPITSYYSSDPWTGNAYGSYYGNTYGISRHTHTASQPKVHANEPGAPWFHEDDADAMFLLLTEGYSELSTLGDVLVSENLSGREVLPPPSVSVSANVRSGLLDIAVDSGGLSPADLVAYLSSYRRKQRFVRLGNGDIMRIGDAVGALADLADGLGVKEDDLVEGVQAIPANRTLFVDALLKKSGVRFARNDAFRSIVRDFDTIADGDFAVPETLADTMRQYQVDGFQWLSTLGKLGFGGILADDMGLGKTLQMIAYLLARKRDCAPEEYLPSLVVCPASLVYNWEAEVRKFAPELDVVPVTGAQSSRSAIIGSAAEHDLLVTSYDLMKRDANAYITQQFHCVVLDEAQYIKNHATKAAKSAKTLPSQVRFALTGTPIENRLSELWSIFDFLMPGILGNHEQFAARFGTAISAGDEASAKRLRALIGPFILRRLKEDVLADLPEKAENVVFTHMEGEQARLYRANANKLALQLAKQMPEEFAQDKLRILAELTKLRQICCDPHLFYDNYEGDSAKLETCMELIANAVDGGHRILLFSQFTSMLDIIGARLDKMKLRYLTFTGSTSKEDRASRVARFQDGDVPVFLISLKAGGTGLNLTAADIVIHYDPWWNVAAQNQATDRAHRIGQERNVSVFKLIAKDSIEENIIQMQEQKRHLAEQVIGGEAIGSTKLTREDILALLGAGAG